MKLKKISEYSLTTISLIQLTIATIISLLFQFVFPLTFQPLDVAIHGPDIKHGDPGMNYVIATISLWYFSFSIAWFIYRDNPYLNNFLIYSFPLVSMIFVVDMVEFFLFWDYIHFSPLSVDIYLIWKKRKTLYQMWYPFYLLIISVWIYTVYFLKLAYYLTPIYVYIFNWLSISILCAVLSFSFHDSLIFAYVKKKKTEKKHSKK